MEKQFITTGAPLRVTLEIHGSLKLKGWDEQQVVVKNSAPEHITLEQRGEEIFVRCTSDCSVRVPRQSPLFAEVLHGDAVFKGVEGAIVIKEAKGNLDLRSVGPTRIETAHGALSAKNIFGSLTIGQVDGNTSVRDIQGDFIVENMIRGNLQINDIQGSATARCNGEIALRLDPIPGEAYQFTTNGNIMVRLSKDASAVIKFERAAHLIVNLPDIRLNQAGKQPYEITLGDGDATLALSANGNIQVSAQAPEWDMPGFGPDSGDQVGDMAEAYSEQITRQLEAQMEMLEQQIEAQTAQMNLSLGGVGLSEEQRQRIEERARQAGERARERAEERMRQAQERLERKLAATQRRAEQKSRNAERRRQWSFSWGGAATPPPPPMPPTAPVTDEERMTILRMLEQKQISLEEAEKLLAALEGN